MSDENLTNKTKKEQKNTTDTQATQKKKAKIVSKKTKSVPKNATDTVKQLTQTETDLEVKSEKLKVESKQGTKIVTNLEETKQYLRNSDFEIWKNGIVKCKFCNGKMDIPSAINHTCSKRAKL